MLRIQKSDQRGQSRNGWLDSRHSFSFNQWHDDRYVHFGPLRVLNDDFVRAGGGFPTHPHRDMEILTYVVKGALEHRDSTGGHGVIRAGELQRMTAGRGITHSEFNHSETEDLHFLQVWIIPNERGLEPGYEQKEFTPEQRRNVLLPVAGPAAADGALLINQDAVMYISRVERGERVEHHLAEGRGAYVFVIDGEVKVSGYALAPGDSISAEQETQVTIESTEDAEIVFFDIPLENWER